MPDASTKAGTSFLFPLGIFYTHLFPDDEEGAHELGAPKILDGSGSSKPKRSIALLGG